jgi:putative DNA methylase
VSNDRVTQGDLPHWFRPGHAHFITYRLADTIPAAKLQQWSLRRKELLDRGPPPDMNRREYRERVHKQFFAEYDRYLDSHTGPNWLADPQAASIIRANLYHHHGVKYELLAWCIMSNHVHVVLQPFESAPEGDTSWPMLPASAGSLCTVGGLLEEPFSDEASDATSPLSSIMHSLKSYTANRLNRLLGRTGSFWQRESYDHWIRDLDELEKIVAYVIGNPVAAGLCLEPRLWRYSSAYDRFQRDGSTCGLVGWLRDDWRRVTG